MKDFDEISQPSEDMERSEYHERVWQAVKNLDNPYARLMTKNPQNRIILKYRPHGYSALLGSLSVLLLLDEGMTCDEIRECMWEFEGALDDAFKEG